MSQECSIARCEKPRAKRRRMCYMHYQRTRRHGDPLTTKNRARGSGSINSEGYVTVVCPAEFAPMGQGNGTNGSRRVLLSRLVMAQHLGRLLYPEETVHHKDGDKLNNRLDNLELRTGAHGKHQSIEDAVAWARTLLERYT